MSRPATEPRNQTGTRRLLSRKRHRRVHAALELPSERFGCFEPAGEHGGEQLDRIAAAKGEIRIGGRVCAQPARIATVPDQCGDIAVRAGWRNLRWPDALRKPIDPHKIPNEAGACAGRAIWVARKGRAALAPRPIAVRKSGAAAEAARRAARQQDRKSGYTPSQETLDAAGWFILVASLPVAAVSTEDLLVLHRLRWRVEPCGHGLEPEADVRPLVCPKRPGEGLRAQTEGKHGRYSPA